MNENGLRSKDDDLLEAIRALEGEGSIRVDTSLSPGSYLRFLANIGSSWWIYTVLLASLVEVSLVIDNIQAGPLWVLRLVIGFGLLGFISGYCTIQILFPGDRLNLLEQVLMSIVLSVVISIAIGVSLGAGYRFSGETNVVSLSAYTVASAIIAGYRRYALVKPIKSGGTKKQESPTGPVSRL